MSARAEILGCYSKRVLLPKIVRAPPDLRSRIDVTRFTRVTAPHARKDCAVTDVRFRNADALLTLAFVTSIRFGFADLSAGDQHLFALLRRRSAPASLRSVPPFSP
jgi:hypothetical protein